MHSLSEPDVLLFGTMETPCHLRITLCSPHSLFVLLHLHYHCSPYPSWNSWKLIMSSTSTPAPFEVSRTTLCCPRSDPCAAPSRLLLHSLAIRNLWKLIMSFCHDPCGRGVPTPWETRNSRLTPCSCSSNTPSSVKDLLTEALFRPRCHAVGPGQ